MTTDPLTTWGALARRYADRAAWEADRRAGIGASQVAAILGRSPYAGSWDVWCGLHARDALPTPTDAQRADWRRGHIMEDAALAMYADATGATVDACDPSQVWREAAPWQRCSPDGVVLVEGKPVGLVEAKSTRDASGVTGWPDAATGMDATVPRLDWTIQATWQCIVTGAPWCDLAMLGPWYALVICRITPTADEREALLAAVTRWWDAYGHGLDTPPADGSDAHRRYRAQCPRGPDVADDPGGLLAAWAAARDGETAAKAAASLARGRVMEAMGEHRGLTDGRWTARYDKRGALRLTGGTDE